MLLQPIQCRGTTLTICLCYLATGLTLVLLIVLFLVNCQCSVITNTSSDDLVQAKPSRDATVVASPPVSPGATVVASPPVSPEATVVASHPVSPFATLVASPPISPSVDVPPQMKNLVEGLAPEPQPKRSWSLTPVAQPQGSTEGPASESRPHRLPLHNVKMILLYVVIFSLLLAQILAFALEMVFFASVKKAMNHLGPAIHTNVGLGSFVI